MANIINISEKLKREKKTIVLDGKEYEVDDSKNAYIEMMAAMQNLSDTGDLAQIDKAIELLAGHEFLAKVNKMKLNIEDTRTVLISLMATVQGVSFEEASARFRGEDKE